MHIASSITHNVHILSSVTHNVDIASSVIHKVHIASSRIHDAPEQLSHVIVELLDMLTTHNSACLFIYR